MSALSMTRLSDSFEAIHNCCVESLSRPRRYVAFDLSQQAGIIPRGTNQSSQ